MVIEYILYTTTPTRDFRFVMAPKDLNNDGREYIQKKVFRKYYNNDISGNESKTDFLDKYDWNLIGNYVFVTKFTKTSEVDYAGRPIYAVEAFRAEKQDIASDIKRYSNFLVHLEEYSKLRDCKLREFDDYENVPVSFEYTQSKDKDSKSSNPDILRIIGEISSQSIKWLNKYRVLCATNLTVRGSLNLKCNLYENDMTVGNINEVFLLADLDKAKRKVKSDFGKYISNSENASSPIEYSWEHEGILRKSFSSEKDLYCEGLLDSVFESLQISKSVPQNIKVELFMRTKDYSTHYIRNALVFCVDEEDWQNNLYEQLKDELNKNVLSIEKPPITITFRVHSQMQFISYEKEIYFTNFMEKQQIVYEIGEAIRKLGQTVDKSKKMNWFEIAKNILRR